MARISCRPPARCSMRTIMRWARSRPGRTGCRSASASTSRCPTCRPCSRACIGRIRVVARNASRHVDEPARAIRRTPVRCGDRAARAGRRPAARRRHAAVFRNRSPGSPRRTAPRAGEPLPLAVLAGPCGVRGRRAARARPCGRPWRERFTGGGVAAVTAAAAALRRLPAGAGRAAHAGRRRHEIRAAAAAAVAGRAVLRVRDARAGAALRRFADSLAISA